MLDHSSRQNWWGSWKFVGSRARTCHFNLVHKFSIRLRSGFWEGHSKTFIFFCLSHFETIFALCFGSLSCWKVHLWRRCNFLTDNCRFFGKIFKWSSFFMIPSTLESSPVRVEAKQPHSIMLPPLCFTVGMVFLGLNACIQCTFGHHDQKALFLPHQITEHYSEIHLLFLYSHKHILVELWDVFFAARVFFLVGSPWRCKTHLAEDIDTCIPASWISH